MNLKNLIGKKIYSIYEGEAIGTIMDICFNDSFSKISSFVVFDNDEDEYSLPLSSIMSMCDCVMIKNKTKLCELTFYNNLSSICKEVFDDGAKSLGIINDATFDENGNILKYITDCGIQIEPKQITIRKNFILFCNKKIVISRLRPKNKDINLNKIKVNILKINDINKNEIMPSKLKYNPQNILGKISKGDLMGMNNEIIIKTNQTITEKTIKDATKHNRLNQLYYLAN